MDQSTIKERYYTSINHQREINQQHGSKLSYVYLTPITWVNKKEGYMVMFFFFSCYPYLLFRYSSTIRPNNATTPSISIAKPLSQLPLPTLTSMAGNKYDHIYHWEWSNKHAKKDDSPKVVLDICKLVFNLTFSPWKWKFYEWIVGILIWRFKALH